MRKRVVVVTGASAGVGRAAVRAFAASGAAIGLIARGTERLDDAVREIRNSGGEALAIAADVADAEAVDRAAEQIERTLGPIDVWVNAAMATVFAPLQLIAPAEYRRATEVTYLGCVHGTTAALRRMRPRNRGTIVQVGSALAYRSVPLQSAYCGAKAAIRAFTDSLRSELIHDRTTIRLTIVHLPAVNTPQFDRARNKLRHRLRPMPPAFQPEVAARAIVFASNSRRREIYVGGSTLQAVFGTLIAPGLLDRLLAKKAYRGQLTDELEPPGRPDNLFEPAPASVASHGRFTAHAKRRSLELWLAERLPALTLGAGIVAIAAGCAVTAPRIRRRSA